MIVFKVWDELAELFEIVLEYFRFISFNPGDTINDYWPRKIVFQVIKIITQFKFLSFKRENLGGAVLQSDGNILRNKAISSEDVNSIKFFQALDWLI